MNFLIIGGGAREHAIAKCLHRSSQKPTLYCYASFRNPGIEVLTKDYEIGDMNNCSLILNKAKAWEIDVAIIGPEAPLEQGLADVLWAHAIPTVGPTKKLARIETSKAFARDLLKKYSIPGSIQYEVFHNLKGVQEFLSTCKEAQYVIKADGLMGGKGVKVAGEHLHTLAEAYQFCVDICAEGQSFIIEEKIIGQEFSLLNFSDGYSLIPMPVVQDHKRAYVNDEGPNTGGMGSYSDANHRLPFLSVEDLQAAQKINEAVIQALMTECGEKYIGILYGSFMLTKNGVRLIEYNARFGDPEALNVLAILETDLVTICQALCEKRLANTAIHFAPLATVCKYAVPEGYPNQVSASVEIDIAGVSHPEQLYIGGLHRQHGKLMTTGSRTLAALGIGRTITDAEKQAEHLIQSIQGSLYHRADIGTDALIQKRIQHMKELRQCIA